MTFLISLSLLTAAADPAAPATPKPPVDPNKRVCRLLGPPLGSRLGERRQCKTRAEWEEERIAVKQALQRAQVTMGTHGK
jgi:hypothetical protein